MDAFTVTVYAAMAAVDVMIMFLYSLNQSISLGRATMIFVVQPVSSDNDGLSRSISSMPASLMLLRYCAILASLVSELMAACSMAMFVSVTASVYWRTLSALSIRIVAAE